MAANSNSAKTKGIPSQTPLSAVKSRAETRTDIDIDRLIHERTRLAIVSALAVNKSLTFNDLKSVLKISDGNLSSHARKLEDAGYINCKKEFDGRVPRTQYALTASGRKALKGYISHMESLIKAMKKI